MGAILKKTRLVLPSHTKQVSWQQGGAFHKSPDALIIISSIECQKENTGFHLEVFSIHFNCAYILFWYCQSCLQSWKPKSRSPEMSFQRGMCVCCGRKEVKRKISGELRWIYILRLFPLSLTSLTTLRQKGEYSERKSEKSHVLWKSLCVLSFSDCFVKADQRFTFLFAHGFPFTAKYRGLGMRQY